MISIVVKFNVHSECSDAWIDRMGDFTHATREEPGNLFGLSGPVASRTRIGSSSLKDSATLMLAQCTSTLSTSKKPSGRHHRCWSTPRRSCTRRFRGRSGPSWPRSRFQRAARLDGCGRAVLPARCLASGPPADGDGPRCASSQGP
jgi:hypothetical protein